MIQPVAPPSAPPGVRALLQNPLQAWRVDSDRSLDLPREREALERIIQDLEGRGFVPPMPREEPGRKVDPRTYRLEADWTHGEGLFQTALLRCDASWSSLLVTFFPYDVQEGSPWDSFLEDLFAFERDCWAQWMTHFPSDKSGNLNPQEVGLTTFERNRLPFCGATRAQENDPLRFHYLVRPYLSWPTLRDAFLSPERQGRLFADFLGRVLPGILAQDDRVPLADLENALTRRNPKYDDLYGPSHFLSDGHHIVPTRWRPFHVRGRAIRESTFGEVELHTIPPVKAGR